MWPWSKVHHEIDPQNAGPAAEQAAIEQLIRSRRLEEAEDRLRQRVHESPTDAWARNKLAVVLAVSNRPNDARSVLDELLADNPDHVPAIINRGNLYFEDGNLDEAERHYRRALELDPHSANAFNNLAAIHKKRGNLSAMVGDLKRAGRARQRPSWRRGR